MSHCPLCLGLLQQDSPCLKGGTRETASDKWHCWAGCRELGGTGKTTSASFAVQALGTVNNDPLSSRDKRRNLILEHLPPCWPRKIHVLLFKTERYQSMFMAGLFPFLWCGILPSLSVVSLHPHRVKAFIYLYFYIYMSVSICMVDIA